ncbi:hypothetical protein V6N13_069536 [Hibiscus sabdariffa]
MGGQVDRETGLSGAGGAHNHNELGLVLMRVVVDGGGVHPGPPGTTEEGKRRVKEWVKRRGENGFHGE